MDKEKFVKWLKEQLNYNENLATENRKDTEVKRMFEDIASGYRNTLEDVEAGNFDNTGHTCGFNCLACKKAADRRAQLPTIHEGESLNWK